MTEDHFWAPRRCLREPIPQILEAAQLLSSAVDAHLADDLVLAESLIRSADIPEIGEWTESIWGKEDQSILRVRKVEPAPPSLPYELRPTPRAPVLETKRKVVERDGYRCRFCGIPVIDPKLRDKLRKLYPNALRWARPNARQHSAFQCMWLQYDHVLPNSRGGDSSIENLVVTCSACNFGRMERTLEEVGLQDPRLHPVTRSSWDGLERLFAR